MSERKTYAEKLKDERWQIRRIEILERDNWKCQMCGDTEETMVVHHKYYIWGNDPWDYSDEALISSCDPCHKKEHKNRGSKNVKTA